MIPPFQKTKEDFESRIGVNHLAHFVLTARLMGLLKSTANTRVVMLSSLAHRKGEIDFDNLNAGKKYSKMGAYRQSKRACLMFAYELQPRLEKAGSNTIAVAAHPGVSNIELGSYIPTWFMFLLGPLLCYSLPIHPKVLHGQHCMPLWVAI